MSCRRLWKVRARIADVAYRVAMRTLRARVPMCGALACLALVGTLTGCSSPEPAPTPSASTQAPVFASDEEALAAAEKAYTDYLAMSDLIAQEGGANPERMEGLLTENFLASEIAGFTDYSARGLRQVGSSSSDGHRLQSTSLDPENFELRVYACLDVASTDVIDAAGISVVPASRDPRIPLELSFELADGQFPLRVAEPITWGGADYCD